MASLFVEAIDAFGVPELLRTDCGTENVIVAGMMAYIHQSDDNHLYGKSTSNQRIEALWSRMRSTIIPWIDFFRSLVADNILCIAYPMHMNLSQYCFSHLVQKSLDEFMMFTNNHHVRKSSECPAGKPNALFFCEPRHGVVISGNMKAELQRKCSNATDECYQTMVDYFDYVRQSLDFAMPSTRIEAKALFIAISNAAQNM